MGKKEENYGDLLSKYLVEKISGKEVEWIQPQKNPWYKKSKTSYLSAGSIIHHATEKSIVWGSGIIDRQQEIARADFRAVRGPETRKYLLEKGYDCPEVYGDPVLLLPTLFCPTVTKKYETGIVPHYNDFQEVTKVCKNLPDVKVINMMTENIENTTCEILACKKIISSSLHGIIVSHSFQIPAIGVEFSDRIFGDGIKYKDYYESVGMGDYKLPYLNDELDLNEMVNLFKKYPSLPDENILKHLQKGLTETCPFWK